MSKKNENILEMTIYVGDNSAITACLLENDNGKLIRITMNDTSGMFSKTLDAQEVSLLIESLERLHYKQTPR